MRGEREIGTKDMEGTQKEKRNDRRNGDRTSERETK